MKALSYLLFTTIKNRILSLKKKPGLLILYSIIVITVVFSVVMMLVFGDTSSEKKFADERILYLIIAGFGFLYLWIFTSSGLSTGSSLFTMPDVGLLFVAPISSKKILMYGLISTLGKSLLGSVFILYQVGNLKNNFNYGVSEILILFIIFALMVLFCQLLSIGIYIFSNGNEKRKNLVKTLLYALFAIIILSVLFIQRQEQTTVIKALLQLADTMWFKMLPVGGWMMMFFVGAIQGSFLMMLLPLLLFLGIGIIMISLLTFGKADYYEDVLTSTEFTYQTKNAAKEGRTTNSPYAKKIKVKDQVLGINKGSGAMTLFYKHMLEMKRKNRFVFVDGFTVFVTLMVGGIGYILHKNDAPSEVVYGILGSMIYLQFFLTIMGRLKTELLKPYIFLIPESSLKKVLAASLTSLLKPCVDGIAMFAAFAIVDGADVLTCLFCAIAYAASGAVFTGLTILYQRVLGGQPNKLVQMFLGVGLLFAIMTPSIGASVLAAFLLPEPLRFLCTLPYTLFCSLFAAIMFVTCGNLIDKSEYTGKL